MHRPVRRFRRAATQFLVAITMIGTEEIRLRGFCVVLQRRARISFTLGATSGQSPFCVKCFRIHETSAII
jgi:hypothetical protein